MLVHPDDRFLTNLPLEEILMTMQAMARSRREAIEIADKSRQAIAESREMLARVDAILEKSGLARS